MSRWRRHARAYWSCSIMRSTARRIKSALRWRFRLCKHWVSEVESSRHIQWLGQWRRVNEVARELRQAHPERFRSLQVHCRNGEMKSIGVFTEVVRLKR